MQTSSRKSVGFTLWVIFFCFSCCAALVFQKVLLPIISPETAGTGLLPNDATYFHEMAIKFAADIREHGWGQWTIFPAHGASGNVSILAAIYVVFGNDPAYILPINASIHAFGGILIFLLIRTISNNSSSGFYAGIIAASLFVVFPSALNWYGQLHKDGYAIAGVLLVLLALIRSISMQQTAKGIFLNYLAIFVGVMLIGIVRPYNLKLILVSIVILPFLVAIFAAFKGRFREKLGLIAFLVFTNIFVAFSSNVLTKMEHTNAGESYGEWVPSTWISPENSIAGPSSESDITQPFRWEKSTWLPLTLEGQIEIAARTRAGLIEYGLHGNANSMMDAHETPQSTAEVLVYLPRALQIAALAPFPATWFDNLSPMRLVATAEMLVYYICLPGIFLLLWYNRSTPVLLAIYFASVFLMIYGFTLANLGTLYRLRYAHIFILLSLGVLGWATWVANSGKFDKLISFFKGQMEYAPSIAAKLNAQQTSSRKNTISSSIVVMILTLICFLGFFARDIMMANAYGFGSELDYFFIALMIPMFLVTVLAMPLGSAFVPFYLELREKFSDEELKKTVKGVASLVTWGLLITSIVVFLISPWIFDLYYSGMALESQILLRQLAVIALPLLLFSGVMILGNSLLNAKGKTIFTSVAQLIVPVVAIFALMLFGKKYGVVAVLYGMVVGQILNLAIVQLRLRIYKTSVMPDLSLPQLAEFSPLFKQYWPLVGSAVFIGIAAPISTLLAMSLSDGAVSVFNLGSKVVLFLTGLLGAVVTTVMLPYFSNLMAKNHLIDARRELSFFLLSATFIAVPLSIGIYLSSGLIVDLMLAGGEFSIESREQVTRVMKYSVVQLPFFVCNALLLRFAISTKHVLAIVIIAVLGLIANVLVSIFLMNHMGVAGIALGGSVAMLLSTMLLALVLVRYWHITLLDLIIILLNWMLFITLLIGVHFNNLPSVYIVVIAYVVLMVGYLKSLVDFRSLTIGVQS